MLDQHEGPARDFGEEWEALALRIHFCRTASGRAAAVFGIDRCQRCAALSPFATVEMAGEVHVGADHERVCATCLRREGRAGAVRALAHSPSRFCEGCAATIARAPAHRIGGTWMCAACIAALGADPPAARNAILALQRRRYMAWGFPTLAELRGLERAVLASQARYDGAEPSPVRLDA